MTKEERDEQQNIARVGINLGVLLDIGLFPGKHALGLEECKGLVKSVVDQANEKLQVLAPPPLTPASVPVPPPSATPAA